jgi:hypothetical protein
VSSSGFSQHSNAILASFTTGGALVRGAAPDVGEGSDGGDWMRTEQGNGGRFGGGRAGTNEGKSGERTKSHVYGCAAE